MLFIYVQIMTNEVNPHYYWMWGRLLSHTMVDGIEHFLNAEVFVWIEM